MSTPFRPRVVSLFSGIGATDLALEHLGCETVAHSDIEPYANAVFAKRFPNSKQLGSVTDITEVPACEVMAGGFPCQDISDAGLHAGIGGARSGLWGQFKRLIGIARPKIVLVENVSALLHRGLDVVLADLNELGYSCEWDCVPAAAVGAPHLRDRIWITAYHEDEEPIREDPLERSLGTLALPPSQWPRAGRMCQGAVYVREPLAKRKTKRLNPGSGSAWVGARLDDRHGWWHGRPTFPTPTARDWKDSTGMTPRGKGCLMEAALIRPLWGTPRAADGMHSPLREPAKIRDGDARGRLEDQVALLEGRGGYLNPVWVEWVMGYPLHWTDLTATETYWHGWGHEPAGVPRVAAGVLSLVGRIHALGNGQVPQVARWWIAPAIERLR